MNKARILAAVLSLLFAAGLCQAQSALLNIPRQSQHSVLTQRIGITDITINYHRPLVNGRKIWGDLVPYGQVWRAGANENTTIAFSDPVTIEGQPLDKGVYGPELEWEKLAVPFKVDVDVNKIVEASLHQQLRGLAQYTWEGWDDAANYLLAQKTDLDEALKYEDQSIQVEKRFDNLLTKSNILEALNRKDEADTTRQQALALANPLQLHIYARQLQDQKRQDEAFVIFRENARKHPQEWFVHTGMARIYSSQGKFDDAVKEMNLALAAAPDGQKSYVEGLVKRLQAKQDIN